MDRISPKGRYIASVIIYGTIGAILRFISFPSEFVVLCRGAIGGGFVLLFSLARHAPPDRAAIRANGRWLLLSGICLGLNWVLLFAAYRRTTVAVASLCNYMAPVIVVLLSPLLYRERIGGKKGLCVLASFVGIVLVSGVLGGQPEDLNRSGMGAGLAAALAFTGILLCNRKLRGISAYDRAIVQLLVSALTVLPYVLLSGQFGALRFDARSVWLTLLLCLFHTGVAYCLYFGSLGDVPVQTIAVWGYLEPVVAVLCSALILGEPLSIAGWIGAALIVGSAVISERAE